MAIISRPATGEILAMANVTAEPRPDGALLPAEPSSNNASLTATFEPGSVNKVITMAAALESGVTTPDTLHRGARPLPRCSTRPSPTTPATGTAQWTPTDILVTSSNVGTIKIAEQLGKERLDAALRRFGLGDAHRARSSRGETRGRLLDPEDYSGTSLGSIAIGQGISVTAMQMLGAFNVIANDGAYVAPRLVEATVAPDGTRRKAAGGCQAAGRVRGHRADRAGHDGQGGLRGVRHGHPRAGAGVHGGRQDGHGPQADDAEHARRRVHGPRRPLPLRGHVRRVRARRAAGAVDHRGHRRAHHRVLRERRVGARPSPSWPATPCAATTSRRPPCRPRRTSPRCRRRRAGVGDAPLPGPDATTRRTADRCDSTSSSPRSAPAPVSRASSSTSATSTRRRSTSCRSTHDSAAAEPGTLFCCVPGPSGRRPRPRGRRGRAGRGRAAGRAAPRPAGAPAARVVGAGGHGPGRGGLPRRPVAALPVVGVTGTNGKTTVCHLRRPRSSRPRAGRAG